MNQLQRVFNYQGAQIRTVTKDGEIWFVAKDVCDALGILDARKSVNLLDEDERNSIPVIDSLGRNQETLIINEPGLYSLILKSRKPEAKAFKRWITHEVLPSIRQTGQYQNPYQTQFQPWADQAGQHLFFAKQLASLTGVKEGIAFASAIEEAERETGRSLDAYKKLLPAVNHVTGYLTPTDLGSRFNLSAQKTNKILEKLGLQEKRERENGKKEWRLTETGKEFGEEFPFVRNGHSGYQIRWSEKVIERLQKFDIGLIS